MASSNSDGGTGPDRAPTTDTPLWVKVFGIIFLVVVLLFVILMLTRGPGGRGPHVWDDDQEQQIGAVDGAGHEWSHP